MSNEMRRTWWVAPLAGAAAALALEPAEAQFPDLLSATECPGCAAAPAAEPGITGTWSTPLTSSSDPRWTLEDFFCVVACTPAVRASTTALLRDPANARRPTLELYAATVNANAQAAARLLTPAALAAAPHLHDPTRSPRFACDPNGFAAQVVSPLPLEIARHTAGFTLHYEEFGANRIVLLDGAAPSHPNHPHPFGVSKGRLEDDGTLVVETRGIPTGKLYDWFGGGPHSAELRATERYTVDGDWLRLELTLDDPQTFREPLVLSKSWRRTHGTAIARYGCDVMAGELDNVFADYVDPRTLDARRGL